MAVIEIIGYLIIVGVQCRKRPNCNKYVDILQTDLLSTSWYQDSFLCDSFLWKVCKIKVAISLILTDLLQFDEVAKLQKAGKSDNLRHVCGVFGFVDDSKTESLNWAPQSWPEMTDIINILLYQ